jgi:omega-6 fatty acid desaturase (delta-12 desaturase)
MVMVAQALETQARSAVNHFKYRTLANLVYTSPTQMRNRKELLLASKAFMHEDRLRSWLETFISMAGLTIFLTASFLHVPIILRIVFALTSSLFFVRTFIIYHDYQHHAILQSSGLARLLMRMYGVFILAPEGIWKRSHDHHHTHNSKLTMHGIGSYPTISKIRFLGLSKSDQRLYLINRHPLTVIFGYITLFIYWLNVKSFLESPRKHMDSLLALFLHVVAASAIWYFFGTTTLLVSWIFPFFLSFAIGSYLFYCQHNFPGAKFCENEEWKYEHAALDSTSFMKMNVVLQWFTGNIGYHHVHHLNSRIPFYRLPEAMKGMPEMQDVMTTSWNPVEVYRCLRLKLWDSEKGEMIALSQI